MNGKSPCYLCSFLWLFIAAALNLAVQVEAAAESNTLLTGKAAMGDWRSDRPGVRHKITVQDLPPPSSNVLAINPPRIARQPSGGQPQVLPGCKIARYASA